MCHETSRGRIRLRINPDLREGDDSFSEGRTMRIHSTLGAVLALIVASCTQAPTQQDIVARGRYLVTVMGCGDCHTPGYFLGMPDGSKMLAGSDVSFFLPAMGYFYPPNLTPDATGLGAWTGAQIVTAIRTGVRPDGRTLVAIMPWMDLASLTDSDANAIAAYLKSLRPIMNQVPPPTAADAMPPGPAMAVVAPPGLTPVGLPPPAPPPVAAPPPPAPRGARAGRATR
jgi:mono/diheme cytochrome c family protein